MVNETNEKINIVYTWVDGSDIKWLEKKNSYNQHEGHLEKYSTLNSRFRNSDEIIYSLRSVDQYFPEHGTIYIVTDNQKHPLIDERMVTYIDHSEILEKSPTFSSKKIESNLFKIKPLSENFLYFNDDVFLGPKFNIKNFLNEKQYFFQLEIDNTGNYVTNETLENSNKVLKGYRDCEKYKSYRRIPFKHNPKIVNKKLFKQFIEEFEYAYNIVQQEIFRNLNAASLLSDTYPRWLLAKNIANINDFETMYIAVGAQGGDLCELANNFNSLACFCLNDVADNDLRLDEKINQIQTNLSSIYPYKSKYEI
jgi:hypothetical protein